MIRDFSIWFASTLSNQGILVASFCGKWTCDYLKQFNWLKVKKHETDENSPVLQLVLLVKPKFEACHWLQMVFSAIFPSICPSRGQFICVECERKHPVPVGWKYT